MHAWLYLFGAIGAVMDHRMTDGLALADRAIAVAREHGNADVQFMATSFKGYGELHQGNMQAGLALIDEAAAAATSGQLDLRIASDILCNTIAACRNIGDLKRAGQWADEGERWMRRNRGQLEQNDRVLERVARRRNHLRRGLQDALAVGVAGFLLDPAGAGQHDVGGLAERRGDDALHDQRLQRALAPRRRDPRDVAERAGRPGIQDEQGRHLAGLDVGAQASSEGAASPAAGAGQAEQARAADVRRVHRRHAELGAGRLRLGAAGPGDVDGLLRGVAEQVLRDARRDVELFVRRRAPRAGSAARAPPALPPSAPWPRPRSRCPTGVGASPPAPRTIGCVRRASDSIQW